MEEFAELTPAEFDALALRHLESQRRTAGTIAAAIYNANPFRSKDSKVVMPEDFFPAPQKPEPEQTLEEQIEILTSIFGCGPGKPTVH